MSDLDDLLAEFKGEPKEAIAQPPKRGSLQEKEQHREELRGIEDELLRSSMGVVDSVLAFKDIDPAEEGVPEEWVKKYGRLEAMKRQKLARAGWMPQAELPAGINIAYKLMVGIVKARATENPRTQQLNITMVQMTAPPPQFPVIDVVPEDEK